MNNNILYLAVVGAAQANQPALTEALSRYTHIEFESGHWLIKTNTSPTEFQNTIKGALGATTPMIFRVDASAISGAVLPDDVKRFVTSALSAVA